MGSKLSKLSFESFKKELESLSKSHSLQALFGSVQTRSNVGATSGSPAVETPMVASEDLMEDLWIHYSEICRWNNRLSLIGPGTGADVVRRHYWESLEGLSFTSPSDRWLVDIGSGGGFPGWILSAALPKIAVSLIEPRERKWAFLQSATRKAGLLSCKAVNARVEIPLSSSLELPETIDVVTSRALAISAEVLEALVAHSPRVRFLFWVGKEEIAIPEGYRVTRSKHLPGSDHRRIVEISRSSTA